MLEFNNDVLKDLRIKKGYDVLDILFKLRDCGVRITERTYYRWEKDVVPKAVALMVLSHILGVNYEKFFYKI